ncbi:Xaa-Pro peptidase family protein [Herbivorax sp. ANBcel31]|uniref:M24 family metallopeptidase n=1 Tax=Herbivorax sp. ANBcel31 TaxID=3069754 RepID=UPI0027ADC368|nr:Xaa-Pro peptidase family protein [Herbivorax sp. ANBcel31]MDQ2085054.1 Xaa-Pro peptidase family protein [Herbivorax sp. ANBcel31]
MKKVPFTELKSRMERFREIMDAYNPDWEMAVIFNKVNLYYFTGTMPEGMLLIPRGDEAVLWVRRSFERAVEESFFPLIKPMKSFRDAAQNFLNIPDTIYLETEFVPLAFYKRFQKHFTFENVKPLDRQITKLRSIKSPYEIDIMEKSGIIHKKVLEDCVLEIFEEGMSEAEFATKLYSIMVEEGHHGVARFSMLDTEILVGHICFGESSIYPTYFNGPGGNYGMSPGVPLLGSRERRLKKGDLVFVDAACGVDGYHTDKTMTYMFGESLPDEVIAEHKSCVDIQNKIASMLKPGAIPADIYRDVMDGISPEFKQNFMGFGERSVKFLGHGIGLHVDEMPVIAEGFEEPLKEGMVLALEPKKGIENVGMVGIENTFKVTNEGGVCITGDNPGVIPVF